MGRRDAKIDVYTDRRDTREAEGAAAGAHSDMDNWDQGKLEAVVQERHGAQNRRVGQTAIVCKYFLEALEKRQYGWFWQVCDRLTVCLSRFP